MKFNKFRLLGITLVFSFIYIPSYVSADTHLSFGVYTSDKATTMVKKFRPILNYIESSVTDSLNDRTFIKLQVFNNYEDGIAALTSGKVDFSRMGPSSYILSKEINPNIQLLAMESRNGKRYFWGIICTPINSSILETAQLKGSSFAFGNKTSTIGRYLSQYYLYQNGILEKDLENYQYLSRHDKVASAVASEQFAAGAIKESTFRKQNRNEEKLKVLARFKNITKPWIARDNLSRSIFLALQKSLLTLEDETILKNINKSGFLSASDSDYQSVRSAMNNNHLFFDNLDNYSATGNDINSPRSIP